MESIIDNKKLQPVICIKDNKLYVYKTGHNFNLRNDYTLISCYLVDTNGEPDISKEIEIYGKDLVSAELSEKNPFQFVVKPFW
jgi:hypothetical protein